MIEDDPLLEVLASLPAVQPNAVRSETLRARCRDALAGTQANGTVAALEPAAIAAFCAAYAAQLVRVVLQLSK